MTADNQPGPDAESEQRAYEELQCYTLALGDAEFLHQHVVDAWAAQHATAADKPIRLAFALVGLCLHLERGRTGREVQRAHMVLGGRSKRWPTFPLPVDRGSVTAVDVMAAPPGAARAAAVDAWCTSVWRAHRGSHGAVAALLAEHGVG